MKFLSDESVDHRLTLFLRELGFDVLSIHDFTTGIPDDEVLSLAYSQNAILITEDRDFGYLVIQLGKPHKGVVLIRIKGLSISEAYSLIEKTIKQYGDQLYANFTVVTSNSVRIRFL